MSAQPPGRVEIRPEERQLLVDGQPAEVGEGDHASLLPLLARIAARRGDPHTALKVAGYTLHFWSTVGLRPRSTLSDAELAPQVDAAQRVALMAEGARLSEEQAIQLVLGKGAGAKAA